MFAIVILIYVVFVLLIHTIVQDLRSMTDPSSIRNESNVSLSSLISDSLLNSWIHDTPKAADWKVPYNQHSESSHAESERTTIDPNVTSEFFGSNIHFRYDFSNGTKEHFLESLFRPHAEEVDPDWSVVLGTFEHYADDNWGNYLTQIGIPHLMSLFFRTVSETIILSRIFRDGKKSTKRTDAKSFTNELGTNSADFELSVVTMVWPISYEQQFRLGEPIVLHDEDGTDSLNTYFFAAPCLLVHNKLKDLWTTISILHFHEHGLNWTLIERKRMVMAQRFFKRVE